MPYMKLFTDGRCNNHEPDPAKRTIRAVVTDETGKKLVDKLLKGGSNNIAELWAVAEALKFAKECGITELDLHTDSRNNLAWIDGRIGKNLNDRNAVLKLMLAINTFRQNVKLNLTWIPRKNNVAGVYIENNPFDAS